MLLRQSPNPHSGSEACLGAAILASTNPKDVTLLTKGFRNSSWMEDGSAVDMVLEHASDQLLERILRRGKGDLVEGVCLRVIRDRNRSTSTKARIVLDRIGRDPSPKFVESLSAEEPRLIMSYLHPFRS